MKSNSLKSSAWAALLLSLVWLGLFIADMASGPAPTTFPQLLDKLNHAGWVYTVNYASATLLTASVLVFFGLLANFLRPQISEDARLMGLVFLPVYGAFNLFVYLSQITVIPGLLPLAADPATAQPASLALRMLSQQWAGSAVWLANNLAYAILGIPSILFGLALARRGGLLRAGGYLLAANGAACILGILGIAAGSSLLSLGSVIGGVLFILALVPLAVGLGKQVSPVERAAAAGTR